jgi:hypothetical protein
MFFLDFKFVKFQKFAYSTALCCTCKVEFFIPSEIEENIEFTTEFPTFYHKISSKFIISGFYNPRRICLYRILGSV